MDFWAALIGGVLVTLAGSAILVRQRAAHPLGHASFTPSALTTARHVRTSADVRAGIWVVVGVATIALSVIVFR